MLLYIVRHGLTPWNHLHKAQGSADIPLAQEGIDLARRTGEALMDVKFDICFTSPLTRARQTARLVLGGRDIPVIPDKRIQEINFGVLEGHIMRTGNTMESNCEEFDLFFKDPLKFPRPENGENIQDILDRMDAICSDDNAYRSFSGKEDDMDGNVKFVIETAAIDNDSDK